MDKTDSKIRLLFEMTIQKDVQITSFIPLRNYEESWKPEKMYHHPKNQYYYVFINDPELITRIKEEENKGQAHLYKFAKYLEQNSQFQINTNFMIEFNANSIIDFPNKKLNEEQYAVFTRISIDDFSFINDYKTANLEELLKHNKPLIYANRGKIKELLIGKKIQIDKNNDENNLNNSLQSNKDDKKDEDNEEININAKMDKEKELENKYIPGNWFLVNMNNLNYVKKGVYDNLKKQKVIKFLGLIKYKEVPQTESDTNNMRGENTSMQNQNNNNNQNDNSSDNYEKNSEEEIINQLNVDMKYQQPQEFAFRSSDNSKIITVYQPKSCKEHLKKNDFWCKTCNKFLCILCLAAEDKSKINMMFESHKGHKIHLLDEVINKSEEDSNALDERIKNLMKIIEGEISKKKEELSKLKDDNKNIVKIIEDIYKTNSTFIRNEELKRTKELAALVNEILRINDENNKRISYLNKIYENRCMAEYLTNFYIYKKNFVKETKNNLDIVERKVTELINYYKKNK